MLRPLPQPSSSLYIILITASSPSSSTSSHPRHHAITFLFHLQPTPPTDFTTTSSSPSYQYHQGAFGSSPPKRGRLIWINEVHQSALGFSSAPQGCGWFRQPTRVRLECLAPRGCVVLIRQPPEEGVRLVVSKGRGCCGFIEEGAWVGRVPNMIRLIWTETAKDVFGSRSIAIRVLVWL
ncbi:hypothetical protein Tco_1142573 [Tanacetum coccineum]